MIFSFHLLFIYLKHYTRGLWFLIDLPHNKYFFYFDIDFDLFSVILFDE